MASWTKKISKSVGDDIAPGEQLREGVLLQPSGLMGQLTAKGMGNAVGGAVGGAIGAAVNQRRAGSAVDEPSPAGVADSMPGGPLVLGLTDRRLLGWSWAKLTGRPKELVWQLPIDQVADIRVEKQAATYAFTIVFTDLSTSTFEAPKLGNSPQEFAAAFAAR